MIGLHEILDLQDEITIVDIGASKFSSTVNNYDALKLYKTRLYGFEPNIGEYNKLTETISEKHQSVTFLPFAIADGNAYTLNICAMSGCTSLLEPDIDNAANYVAFAEPLEVVAREQVTTKRLDDIKEIETIDYLKLDIQGAELLAIENGKHKLKDVLVIECEVEFIQQYKNQPRFSEVELTLRSLNFQFHKFLGYGTRSLSPIIINNDPYTSGNQWLWSDAVFVKNINLWHDLPDAALMKMAAIMYEAYTSHDFCYRALNILDDRNQTDYADRFLLYLREHMNINMSN